MFASSIEERANSLNAPLEPVVGHPFQEQEVADIGKLHAPSQPLWVNAAEGNMGNA
jgi:hypothetical protein